MIFFPLTINESINLNYHTGSGWIAWFTLMAHEWDYNIWRSRESHFKDLISDIEDFIIDKVGRQSLVTKDKLKEMLEGHFKDNKDVLTFIDILFKRSAYDEKLVKTQQDIEANRADNPSNEYIPTPVNINQI